MLSYLRLLSTQADFSLPADLLVEFVVNLSDDNHVVSSTTSISIFCMDYLCADSCVGVFKGGRVEIIANDQGNRITPSYVAFTDTERLIGDAAKNQAATNPERTVYDVKRLIGRKCVS